MTDTTIRELLTELSRDPAARAQFDADPDAYMADHGFDLPGGLLGDAIVNVAATLPPETAEHLSAFTIAHSPLPEVNPTSPDDDGGNAAGLDPLAGLGLLASAPALARAHESEPADALEDDEFGEGTNRFSSDSVDESGDTDLIADDLQDLGDLEPDPPVLDDLDDVFDFDPVDDTGSGFEVDDLGDTDPGDLDDLDAFE